MKCQVREELHERGGERFDFAFVLRQELADDADPSIPEREMVEQVIYCTEWSAFRPSFLARFIYDLQEPIG